MSAIGRLLRGQNDIDFQRWWKRGMVLSLVLLVVSVGSLTIRGLNLGVEFTGGVSVENEAEGVSVDEARDALASEGLGTARVQVITDVTGGELLRVQTAETGEDVQETLRGTVAELANADPADVSISTVSASWGSDVTDQALRALGFFLVAIMAYLTIRLELRMAIGAIVATVHDIVITVGIYALFQFEVSPGTVIAFLMILGYSIYDTVVVYDKVKENEPLVGVTHRYSYTQMVSRAMNLVLMRSLNTSITSLLPVVSLLVVGSLLMGAVTLSQFALALAIGLVVGTYSSIMVAAPVVAVIKEREPRHQQLRERLAQGGSAPVVGGAPVDPEGGRTDPAVGSQGASAPGRRVAGPGATPSGAIPPRPRKKPRKR